MEVSICHDAQIGIQVTIREFSRLQCSWLLFFGLILVLFVMMNGLDQSADCQVTFTVT